MPATPLLPVQQEERIWVMDALRGFAILGIFIANLNSGFSFFDPSDPKGAYVTTFDGETNFLRHMLIEGKFYSIFSFLFGWGLALQLQRSEVKGMVSLSFARRRLAFMFLLGLAHIILLWPGDIVAFYALVGFMLLWMRRWKEKTQLVTAIVLLLSPVLLYYIKMKWSMAAAPSNLLQQAGFWVGSRLTGINSQEEYLQYVKSLTFWNNIKLNIAGLFFRFADLLFQSRIPKVLGMFLLGWLMGRHYRQVFANRKLLLLLALAGFVIGLPANYLLAQLMESDGGAYYNLQLKGWHRTMAYAAGVWTLALGYISVFLLFSFTVAGEKVLRLLAPAGKLAFSNYILQSIVGLFVFQSFGANMGGKVGPLYQVFFALMVFVAQVALSHLWLRFFRFGPVEWLWRSATYRAWQPMRIKSPVPRRQLVAEEA